MAAYQVDRSRVKMTENGLRLCSIWFQSVLCHNQHLNELHWGLFLPLWRFVYQSRPWNARAWALLFLDIQPHFGCDLPLSSPQLLLMPASGLRQDGPPVGNSRSSLPKDQLTSISAAEIRCEIKYLILIVAFRRQVTNEEKKKKGFFPALGLLVVRTLNGIVWRQTASFTVQMQKHRHMGCASL